MSTRVLSMAAKWRDTHAGGASVRSFYFFPGKSFKVVKIMGENNISNCDLFSFTFIASAERRRKAPEIWEIEKLSIQKYFIHWI